MKHYLVVANQTLGADALLSVLAERTAAGPARFHVVVPAVPARRGLTWTEGEARAQAASRLRHALRRFRAAGIDVHGVIADANPVLAVADAMRSHRYDEIVISTLPAGASRWLRQDLPSRLRKRFAVTVTHVQPMAVDAAA